MAGGTFFFNNEAEEKSVVVEKQLKAIVFHNEVVAEPIKFDDGKKIHGCHVNQPVGAKCLDLKLCPRQPIRNAIKLPFRMLQIIVRPKCR